MTWNVSAKPDEPEEAIRWFRERVPMTDADYRALRDAAREKAFTVAGVAQLDVVAETYRAIEDAVRDGETLGDFKKKVGDRLRGAWQVGKETSAHRIETIFRTNVQKAYGAGRYEQQSLPSIKKFRPFWMLDVTRDSRQSTICKRLSDPKVILSADDPFWNTHIPPLHFRCRSAIRSLRRAEAERLGILEKAPDEKTDPGFGRPPGEKEWKPDPKDYPPDLAKAFRQKKAPAAAKPKREPKPKPEKTEIAKPKVKPEHTPEHWEKEYKHLGDAAKQAAHGRAMVERGLDLKVSDVARELKALDQHPAIKAEFERLENLSAAEKEKTVRDMRGEFDEWAADRLEGMSSMAAHIRELKGKAKDIGEDLDLDFSTAASQADLADRRVMAADQFFGSMVSKDYKLDRPKVVFSDPASKGKRKRIDRSDYSPSQHRVRYDLFAPNVLEHELMHVIESRNKKALKAAAAFLDRRCEGETPLSLAVIDPGKGYKQNEYARPDKFWDKYIGKVYRDPKGEVFATEVTSMGVQSMLEDPNIYRKDKEFFVWLLGQLAGKH